MNLLLLSICRFAPKDIHSLLKEDPVAFDYFYRQVHEIFVTLTIHNSDFSSHVKDPEKVIEAVCKL